MSTTTDWDVEAFSLGELALQIGRSCLGRREVFEFALTANAALQHSPGVDVAPRWSDGTTDYSRLAWYNMGELAGALTALSTVLAMDPALGYPEAPAAVVLRLREYVWALANRWDRW